MINHIQLIYFRFEKRASETISYPHLKRPSLFPLTITSHKPDLLFSAIPLSPNKQAGVTWPALHALCPVHWDRSRFARSLTPLLAACVIPVNHLALWRFPCHRVQAPWARGSQPATRTPACQIMPCLGLNSSRSGPDKAGQGTHAIVFHFRRCSLSLALRRLRCTPPDVGVVLVVTPIRTGSGFLGLTGMGLGLGLGYELVSFGEVSKQTERTCSE